MRASRAPFHGLNHTIGLLMSQGVGGAKGIEPSTSALRKRFFDSLTFPLTLLLDTAASLTATSVFGHRFSRARTTPAAGYQDESQRH